MSCSIFSLSGEHDVVRVVRVFTVYAECVCGGAWPGNGAHVPWLWDGAAESGRGRTRVCGLSEHAIESVILGNK